MKSKRNLSPAQLQRQFETWQKRMPSKFQDIQTLAEEKGILTPSGKIRQPRGRKQMERFKEFTEQYKRSYKSYSAWEKKQKEKFRHAKENDYTKARSWKGYYEQQSEYSKLLNELFEAFTSAPAYEEKQYLDSLPREEAIQRLRETLSAGELQPIDRYKDEYGSFTPPWE